MKLKILTATDLHCVESLYRQLAEVVELHHPDALALVGDFLDMGGSRHKQLSNLECARGLSHMPCAHVIFTRGNHEDSNWWEFVEAWTGAGREVQALHGEAFSIGPLLVLGFPCAMGNDAGFVGTREPLPEDPNVWLSNLLQAHGPAVRTLWLMHEPPCGTPLTERVGPVSGNPLWNDAIERFSPWLTISGHDHNTPVTNKRWYHRIGQTVCVNVGQPDSGSLHYCVVEAEFTSSKVSLPSKLTVTAYPWEESLTLPEQGSRLNHSTR